MEQEEEGLGWGVRVVVGVEEATAEVPSKKSPSEELCEKDFGVCRHLFRISMFLIIRTIREENSSETGAVLSWTHGRTKEMSELQTVSDSGPRGPLEPPG